MSDTILPEVRVTVVGGGLTGAAAAVQLARAQPGLGIAIVEPRAEVGRGMAYTADDPDHRLNGTPETHSLDLDDPGEVRRWMEAQGTFAADPEAVAANGNVFMRRHDYGAYVRDAVRAHPSIRHVRDVAVEIDIRGERVTTGTAAGSAIESDLALIATGNARPRLPRALEPFASHPAVIVDAGELERVRAIELDARVLLVGSSLTALDIASTLVRRGQRGTITVVSRRGLRPRLHRLAAPRPGPSLLDRIEGPIPAFIRETGSPPRLRALLRSLRARIAEVEAAGGDWYSGFDELRDVVWQLWPAIPPGEKRRFQRQLRHWYDVHRFRSPPQNDAIVRAAEREGRVVYRAMRIAHAATDGDALVVNGERFDALVNCTGLDPAAGAASNPLLASLVARGTLALDASGMGFAVDAQCRPIGRDGRIEDRLRLFGPPTAGTFGDPLGVLFIVPQIRRALPAMLRQIGGPGRPPG